MLLGCFWFLCFWVFFFPFGNLEPIQFPLGGAAINLRKHSCEMNALDNCVKTGEPESVVQPLGFLQESIWRPLASENFQIFEFEVSLVHR